MRTDRYYQPALEQVVPIPLVPPAATELSAGMLSFLAAVHKEGAKKLQEQALKLTAYFATPLQAAAGEPRSLPSRQLYAESAASSPNASPVSASHGSVKVPAKSPSKSLVRAVISKLEGRETPRLRQTTDLARTKTGTTRRSARP